MQFNSTKIPGCYEIFPRTLPDERGKFVKTFSRQLFADLALATDFVEGYYSLSYREVLRGLHFQTPPQDLAKLVYCPAGEVFDAVVDLRVGSPTYGDYLTFTLSDRAANMIYLPPGLAHGFWTMSDQALVMYQVTSPYSPEHDSGILWNSAGIPWPGESPVISSRDRGFVPLAEFASPFRYNEESP
jgi:dTDP-4-dehydrorhamnose 3,5-epimerase